VCLPAYAAGLRPSARGFGVVAQAHRLNALSQFARWKCADDDRAPGQDDHAAVGYKHTRSAAFMADVHARRTGKPLSM
jgi:hypothetical protein